MKKLKYKIVSTIASLKLNTEIDLSGLQEFLRITDYSGRPHFLAYRLTQPKCTVLIYKGGTITFAGLKNFDNITKIKEALLLRLKEFGLRIPSRLPVKIGNIVAVMDVKHGIDIEKLFEENREKQIEYNPEIFPGLLLRQLGSTLVILFFGNGRIVLTGAKSISNIEDGLLEIEKIIDSQLV